MVTGALYAEKPWSLPIMSLAVYLVFEVMLEAFQRIEEDDELMLKVRAMASLTPSAWRRSSTVVSSPALMLLSSASLRSVWRAAGRERLSFNSQVMTHWSTS